MVAAIVPHILGLLFVLVIAHKQAAGRALLCVDHHLAGLAHGSGRAVGQKDVHVIQGAGNAHGAGLGHGAHRVVDGQGGLRLAEALHQGQARGPLPLLEHLRVQGLPGGGGILNGGQVVFAQILLDEEPVHGGRGAEGGDVILGKHRQNVVGVELVEVVGEDGRLVHPLAVVLAPQGLAPACVGDGEVQPFGIHVVPVFGGDVVAQGIFIVVLGNFGVARGAGGEEHEHGIAAAGGVGLALIGVGEGFLVEVVPAQAVLPHHDLHFYTGAVLCGLLRLVGHLTVGGAEDGLHPCRFEAVVEVVFHQQVGGGDDDGAHLMQGGDDEPELVVAL